MFAISSHMALKLDMLCLRSYSKLLSEYEFDILPNKEIGTAKDHGKNYTRVRHPLVIHFLRDRPFWRLLSGFLPAQRFQVVKKTIFEISDHTLEFYEGRKSKI